MASNVVWHHATVTRSRREQINGHRSALVWFTGLSGAGKSTLAHAVEERLYQMGCRTFVLDGDNVRHGLCNDLGFSERDRAENIRRIAEIGKLFVESGLIVLTAFISPFRQDREYARSLFAQSDFLEVFCDCPLDVCERRDVKGIYQKARMGEIPSFTGVSSRYEPPVAPELVIPTGELDLATSVDVVVSMLGTRGVVLSENP